ncbi:HAD-IIB family hydrolase [Planomicrobium sp. YIM 101495]|uniref:HAD-IIB family hydrolase n=1 Tax=Planomicrobium sp. YIM 101495 TaxID=2665160 RepID=UPI0013F8BDDE|nr:HAD-IIB family hydrolase [Planomicrobium sp. YIM 101495]
MNATTHLLATDLDGTFVGDSAELRNLLEFYSKQLYNVTLVYVTGRHFQSALSLMEEEGLPAPDLLVTDVGTEIRKGPEFVMDEDWHAKIDEGWMPDQIDAIAAQIEGIEKQLLPVTNRCSFFARSEEALLNLENHLKKNEIPHKLIYSGGRDVDILPAHSGKGQALLYLKEKYQLHAAKWLVAGDSGNDLEMLTLGLPSVIVGNAQPELKECPEHPNIFRATKPCAGGIQEAWQYFHPS